MNKIYTGIGSRETPKEILDKMTNIAIHLAKQGYILRSGGAEGADTAFERGCLEAQGKMEIYLPWKNFQNKCGDGYIVVDDRRFGLLTCQFHPKLKNWTPDQVKKNWNSFGGGDPALIKLMARNMCQIIGNDFGCDNLTKFVVCYAKLDSNNKPIGGTGQAIRIAKYFNVPIFNLYNKEAYNLLCSQIFL